MKALSDTLKEELRKSILAIARTLNINVPAVYTFGSLGTQYFGPESDVDVAIFADRRIEPEEKLRFVTKIRLTGGHEIDLVDLLDVDLEMQHIVIAAHSRIWINADKKIEVEDFENRVWVLYITSCEDVKPIHDEIKRTGIIYGPDYTPKSRFRSKVHKAR